MNPTSHPKRIAVFLDRDGTINEEVGQMNHLSRLQLYPWAAPAIERLNRAGFLVIVVTNQSGVARGYFTEDLVRKVNQKLTEDLARQGAHLDAVYYCPHHPEGAEVAYRRDCSCRKPKPGMLERAAREFQIELRQSFVIGDSPRDLETGFRAGAHTGLVLTGYGRGEYEYRQARWSRQPEFVAENLLEASARILNFASGHP